MNEPHASQSQRFPKAEHLCSRKLIDQLYAEGHRLRAFPYVVQWMPTEGKVPCQLMIVAPKRKFKHAVDRNHIRRLTRECYRKNKTLLTDTLHEKQLSIAVSMVYSHGEKLSYEQLEDRMVRLLNSLAQEITAL